MPLEELKKIDQDTWLHSGGGPEGRGVCYYMCNFIESAHGPWHQPGSYDQALESAMTFGRGTAMMNYAKSKNLRKAWYRPLRAGGYRRERGRLKWNRIYCVRLWVGERGCCSESQNHEIILVTGRGNDEIVYFEPSFGFFQPTEPGWNNRMALEGWIDWQYSQLGLKAARFRYLNVRGIRSANPKSFNS
jgi:hypothetical protein